MVFQLDQICEDVKICIDQNAQSDTLTGIGDIDTLTLDEIIRSKVVESVERVHIAAPHYLLESGHNFGDAVYWGDQESGWVLLPNDFLRLIVFEMDDWERPVYSAISVDDPEYQKQRGRIKALRGTAQRPVCALALRPEGRALEFYSCTSTDAQVSRAMYIPYPEVDEDDGIDISERCYPAVVYTIAGLTLISCGEAEKGQALTAIANSYLEK